MPRPRIDRSVGIMEANNEALRLNCEFIMVGRGRFALVDKDDYARIKHIAWRWDKGSVRCTTMIGKKKATLQLHRLVMNAPDGSEVDHKNRNSYDNRKCNLRFCTRAQNAANTLLRSHNKTSQFKGVKKYCKSSWSAYISINGKTIYLGRHKTPEGAALLYNKAAIKAFGEFARLNQIPETNP